MKLKSSFTPLCVWVFAGIVVGLFAAASVRAQLPANVVNEALSIASTRVEAFDILGGDYGLSGGSYKASAQNVDINVSKFGGMGDIGMGQLGGPAPLGNTGIAWQPRLQGSMGSLSTEKTFGSSTPLIQGDKNKFDTFAIQFGGGARFWFNDSLSLAPTIMGMYGYTANSYTANSAFGKANLAAARAAGIVDWDINTWTVRPALELAYVYTWRRTIFTLTSDGTYYHSESFNSTNPNLTINGNSEMWQNKIDVDVPLGVEIYNHELRTGGYLSRSDFYGDLNTGLNTEHVYEAHGRVVLDFLGQLWKCQWIGLGYSYLWGSNFTGVTYGVDVAFRF